MSAHSKNSIFSILLLLFVIVLAIGETKIAARAPRKENVAMNLHHLLLRESRTRVQVVHVLRDEQELVGVLGKVRYRFVRCIWLCVPDAVPALAVPFPDKFRISRECFRFS